MVRAVIAFAFAALVAGAQQWPIASAARQGLVAPTSTNGLYWPALAVASSERLFSSGAVPTNNGGVYYNRASDSNKYGVVFLNGSQTNNPTTLGLWVSCWVRHPSLPLGTYKTNGFFAIMTKDHLGTMPVNRSWSLAGLTDANGYPYAINFAIFTNGGNPSIRVRTFNITWPTNRWSKIDAVWHGGLTTNGFTTNFSLYFDGVKYATTNTADTPSIGAAPTGTLARVALFNYDDNPAAGLNYSLIGDIYKAEVYHYAPASNEVAWRYIQELAEVYSR